MGISVLDVTLLVWLGAVATGVVRALTGLGGGIIIVPMLTLLFNVEMRYAIGAALASVIGTSSGAAAAYCCTPRPRRCVPVLLLVGLLSA